MVQSLISILNLHLILLKKHGSSQNGLQTKVLLIFAFNVKIQACKHNHAFFGSVCPECGGTVETEYTRIVGFILQLKPGLKIEKQSIN